MSQRNGRQVQLLADKLNPNEAAKREVRIEARRTVAQQLSREHAITRGMANVALFVLRRGFFGRLKWLLFGR